MFFDNVEIVHNRGALLEETHYYPFGLVMSGISSKAAGKVENRYKFNGIEESTDFEISMYDAFYRNLDPQIGRFWQIDPKPNYGESLYSVMSNNPILYSDFLGDTIKYATGAGGDMAKQMVEKFVNKTIINNKGKEIANKNYNEAFANIVGKLNGAADNFIFNFDESTTEGLVSYDGKDVNIKIAEPGDAYGTKIGAEGILFEETKHAEQVLDGKTFFGLNASGKWGASTNLQNEIEAKMFAGQELGIKKYYTEQESGSEFHVPTQLGYLKYFAKTDADKMLYLNSGVKDLSVSSTNGKFSSVNINGTYPKLLGTAVNNPLTERTKTSQLFGYPRRL